MKKNRLVQFCNTNLKYKLSDSSEWKYLQNRTVMLSKTDDITNQIIK